jgi:glycosyltransferase involved in cell wall biosynthesis
MADPVMNVLLLATRLRANDDGRPIAPLLDRLSRRGTSAEVLCVSAEIIPEVDVRVVECPGLRDRWQRALTVRRLHQDGGVRRPDLMHVLDPEMGPVALDLADRWRIPYVQSVEDFPDPMTAVRVSRRWCRRLIASCGELVTDLHGSLGIPEDALALVPPGIAAPDEAPVRPAPGRVPVIGTAGPLTARSGFATFLGAARRVIDAGTEAEFVIAGGGADEVDLRRRADRLGIADRVTFAGNPALGGRLWNVLDVYCQTSIAPTVGRTLAVALAFGVPSIASDIEGLRPFLTHEVTGLRVPPGDPSALGQSILALLSDPPLARRLGEAGRAAILRDFTPDAEAEALVDVYRQALSCEVEPLARFGETG